jgi:hypothetical protein
LKQLACGHACAGRCKDKCFCAQCPFNRKLNLESAISDTATSKGLRHGLAYVPAMSIRTELTSSGGSKERYTALVKAQSINNIKASYAIPPSVKNVEPESTKDNFHGNAMTRKRVTRLPIREPSRIVQDPYEERKLPISQHNSDLNQNETSPTCNFVQSQPSSAVGDLLGVDFDEPYGEQNDNADFLLCENTHSEENDLHKKTKISLNDSSQDPREEIWLIDFD